MLGFDTRVMLNEMKHLGFMGNSLAEREILRLRAQNDTVRAAAPAPP